MRKFLALLHLDYKRIISLIAKLALLLSAFFVVIALIFTLSDKKLDIDTSIALVTRDQAVEVKILIRNITSNKLENIVDFYETDYNHARELLKNNEVIAIVALPEDIMGQIYNREIVDISIYSNNPKEIRVQFLKKYIDNLLFSLNEGQSVAMIYWDVMREQNVAREERIQSFNSLALTYMTTFLLRGNVFGDEYNIDKFQGKTFIHYYFFSMLVILMIISTILFHSFLDDDIKKGKIERLLSSNYSITHIYASKIVGGVLFSSIGIILLKAAYMLVFSAFSLRALFVFIINYTLVSIVIQSIIIVLYLYVKNEILRDGVFMVFILAGSITGGLILPFQSLPNYLSKMSQLNIFSISHNLLMSGKGTFRLADIFDSSISNQPAPSLLVLVVLFLISVFLIVKKHRAGRVM
ncbi:ABC transporter permease [bacterium AH-315-G05]|nr:ABC transporter permease [bacterium AH-315-L21]MBN4069323.1 ABC transporter permease [bacterium AH-315-G05]